MARNVRLDAKGERRIRASPAATAYYVVLEARPAWPHYKAALIPMEYVNDERAPERFGAALDQELERRLQAATERDRKRASARAVIWDRNPFRKDTTDLLYAREVARPAVMARAEWFAQVQDDRKFARGLKKADTAHEATKTYGKAAKYLEKDAPTGGGDTHNTLVVVNQLKERFTIEQLEKLLVLSGSDDMP